MAKLWDRLRRRFGGGEEQESDTARTEAAERPDRQAGIALPAHLPSPEQESDVCESDMRESDARNAHEPSAPTMLQSAPTPAGMAQTVIPQWWTAATTETDQPARDIQQAMEWTRPPETEPPHPAGQHQPSADPAQPAGHHVSLDRSETADHTAQPVLTAPVNAEARTDTPVREPTVDQAALPVVLPPELRPLIPAAPPAAEPAAAHAGATMDSLDLVPQTGGTVTTAATQDVQQTAATQDVQQEVQDETLADAQDNAAPARDLTTETATDGEPAGVSAPEPWYGLDAEQSAAVAHDVGSAPLSPPAVDGLADDEANGTADSAANDEDDAPVASSGPVTSPAPGTSAKRRRGKRSEPSELDGQPARMVLPGRPLKRNEVPTLDTPLFLWSHDPSGGIVVQPALYACVETQWYGPSLYFLVIPWAERDASDRTTRLVVDSTQLRVAPAEMVR